MSAHFANLLDDLRRRSFRMASLVEDMVAESCEAALQIDHNLARRVIHRDEDVDTEEVQVESEVIRLMALFQPVGVDIRLLCTILKANSDLERVADCAVNIAERARHLDPKTPLPLDTELKDLIPLVRRSLRKAIHAFTSEDGSAAREVLADDDLVDALYGQFVQKMVTQAGQSPERMAMHMDILSVAKNLERIADHATNIAEDVVFLATGQIVRHRAT
ncbi:MAG: phosphate signaling complex protein PhoU [Phycisphaerae bacterium]|nr:phosphate signaling complex protein PhoU [Phycisphaerae bacterium]